MKISIKQKPESEGRPLIPHDLEIVDQETGQSIKNLIRSLDVQVRVDEAVIAAAELYLSSIELEGLPARWFIRDPRDGAQREIERVVFKEGPDLE